jgi:prevent-host-death family protein
VRFEIVLAPGAVADLKALPTPVRTDVKNAIERHLRHEPKKVSKSRIKRLRGLRQPQYRLRVDDIRVFMTLLKRRSKSSPSARKSRRKRGSTKKGRATTPRAVALAAVKDDFCKYLRLAEEEEIVITRHGRPAGVLIGFASEDDRFEYRIEHHPEFLRRVADARAAIREGRGVRLEEA